MLKGRYDECLKILHDIAKANKRDLPPNSILMNALQSLHNKVWIYS